ncbi:hypothetical protein ACUXPZ_000993 [Staphylococcus epidermidis]
MILISNYMTTIFILFISLPLVISRHLINKDSLSKFNLKINKSITNSIILMNVFITVIIFFTSFFILNLNQNVNNVANSIKITLYFTIYYFLNVILLSYRMFLNNRKINIKHFEDHFSPYRIEIYLFALVINFTIIIFKNTFTQSMYNAFTFLIIFDTLISLILKTIKNYVKNGEE